MRRIAQLSLLLVLSVGAFQGVAIPAEVTTVQIGSATVGSNIVVTGTLDHGTDATGPTKVGTDGSGDASAPRLGFDIGDATVTPDLAGKKLTLSLAVHDGIPGIDGIGPAAGYVWPLAFNNMDNSAWLAAGTFVSGWLPKAGKWFEICSTANGSYTCGNAIPGTMTAAQVSWTIPFKNTAGPAWTATYGSTLNVGAATPGTPGVIPWAVVSGGSTFDVVNEITGYKIPGLVEVGIAPAGTQESKVQYTASGAYNPATSGFSVAVPKPAAGSYELFVRSCFGVVESLTCAKTSQPLTV
jgi:hypothetical protein